MTAREVIALGLWTASVIEVARFTWEAYAQTYEPFPGIGGPNIPAPPVSVLPGVLPPDTNKNSTPLKRVVEAGGQPITPQGTGVQGIVNTIGGALSNLGKTIGGILGNLP